MGSSAKKKHQFCDILISQLRDQFSKAHVTFNIFLYIKWLQKYEDTIQPVT